jgi:hypothetical protein
MFQRLAEWPTPGGSCFVFVLKRPTPMMAESHPSTNGYLVWLVHKAKKHRQRGHQIGFTGCYHSGLCHDDERVGRGLSVAPISMNMLTCLMLHVT